MAKILSSRIRRMVASAPLPNRAKVLKPRAEKVKRTLVERLDIEIEESSRIGYRFTDHECGISHIAPKDIEYNGDGVFTIRSTCSPEYLNYGLDDMVDDVCKAVGSEKHLFKKIEGFVFKDYHIPRLDFVWVVSPSKEWLERDDEDCYKWVRIGDSTAEG